MTTTTTAPTSTVRRTFGAPPNVDRNALTLTHSGSVWCGSFYVIGAALLADVLEDAGPVEAHIVTKDGSRFVEYAGRVESFDRDAVRFEDGTTVEWEHILTISIDA